MDNLSYWRDTAQTASYEKLTGQEKYDIAIIGAGLTGITTAVLLVQSGAKVAVVEADRVGSGTTGNTTAKITIQHGLKYHTLAGDNALAYAAANRIGLDRMASFVSEHTIDCDFKRLPSYIYTRKKADVHEIEKEARACDHLGLKCRMDTQTDLPFDIERAIVMDDMAQFHPLKYLYALADIFVQRGGRIYEQSQVMDVERGQSCVITTGSGQIKADTVVMGTNYPISDFRGLFFIKLHQERSYIISTDAKDVDVGGMYINAGQPVNSIRMHRGQLMLGGYGHKTGMEDDTKSGFSSLRDLLHTDFSDAQAKPGYQWAAQDSIPLDGMPYIGAIAKMPDIYVATGYAKWGMTNATAAAMMIADSITGSNMIDRDISKHFSPARFTPGASAKSFFVQSADTLKAYTAGNIGIPTGDYDDIAPGKGAVIRIDGKAQAVYRDPEGRVHAFKAHCTHLGCPLEYNEAENSFDCPCHGSRFSMQGEVLEGPAKRALDKVTEETE